MQPSSPRNPCPICGRDDSGGDCRIRPDGAQVLCHYGSSFHPPADLKPGAVITGKDGRQWAFTGPSADERTAVFVIDQPSTNGSRPHPPRAPQPMASHSPAPLPPNIELALLPEPAPVPPARWPSNHELIYSDSQKAVVSVKPDGSKAFYVHSKSGEQWTRGAGGDPWPLYRQNEACSGGHGKWILELEGEKCAEWVRAAGAIAISQPGHAHRIEQITPRYRALAEAGIAGVVYISDNDKQGLTRAEQNQKAAGEAGLPWLHLPASSIWPEIPEGGSIDDASGSPVDRLQAIRAAIPLALQKRTNTSAADPVTDRQLDDLLGKPDGDGPRSVPAGKAQAVIRLLVPLRWNDLTNRIENEGEPVLGDFMETLYLQLASRYNLAINKTLAADAALLVARSNAYHPVRDYLRSVENSSPRLTPDEWAQIDAICLGADCPLGAVHLQRQLIAAVARIFQPGCKVQTCLIFYGPQGIGKSAFWSILGGSWFSDSLGDLKNLKDDILQLHSSWIHEWGEIDSILGRRSSEQLKRFTSICADDVRRPYSRAVETLPRSCVLVGTTNRRDFLNDPTGNRRFPVIDATKIDLDWIATNRDRIWATAVAEYRAGARWYYTSDENQQITEDASAYAAENPVRQGVEQWIEAHPFVPVVPVARVIRDLGWEQDGRPNDQTLVKQVSTALQSLGWEKNPNTSRFRHANGDRITPTYGYRRPGMSHAA